MKDRAAMGILLIGGRFFLLVGMCRAGAEVEKCQALQLVAALQARKSINF